MIDYARISSPAFVLEEELLERNLIKIKNIGEKAGVQVILAFKGFAMWSTFPVVKKYLDGAAASSLHEAMLCNEKMGCKSHTYMVAYKLSEFDQIIDLSSHITFNSLSQYETFISKVPHDISVGLRVNPEWSDVTTDLYNPASSVSRLGVTRQQMPDTLSSRIEGLHFHVLCESSAKSLVRVLDEFEKKFSGYFPDLKWINFGGGHLMTGEGYDTKLLIETLQRFRKKHDVQIILEPGSAIAWETGDLVATVLDVVENGNQKTAIVDVSFTCHMPDCLEMPYRPIIMEAHDDPSKGNYPYRIGGISCLAGDYLDAYGFDKALRVGDVMVFCDMIHYTMVKTTTFNGIRHPSICIVRKDGSLQTIRRFGYQDYRDRLS